MIWNPNKECMPREQMRELQGKAVCTCDGVSATPTNWVMDRILNKL